MYSIGDEFEYKIDETMDDFTCVAKIIVNKIEYLICENEYGVKKVFYYDLVEEEVIIVDEDEESAILDAYENELYVDADSDFDYWNDDFNDYDEKEDLSNKMIETDDFEFDVEDLKGSDFDDFLEDFFLDGEE